MRKDPWCRIFVGQGPYAVLVGQARLEKPSLLSTSKFHFVQGVIERGEAEGRAGLESCVGSVLGEE